MGCSTFSAGSELEHAFLQVIKRCFLGEIKPGDYTGMLGQADYDPLVKNTKRDQILPTDKSVPYHVVLIMARYGVQGDADIANDLYCFLTKKNNIPAAVIVTRAEKNTRWDALRDVDPSALFFVENYLPNEKLDEGKSKRLLIPLLEAIKRVERSDIYWSIAEEAWSKRFHQSISLYLKQKSSKKVSSQVPSPSTSSSLSKSRAIAGNFSNTEGKEENLLKEKKAARCMTCTYTFIALLVAMLSIIAGIVFSI